MTRRCAVEGCHRATRPGRGCCDACAVRIVVESFGPHEGIGPVTPQVSGVAAVSGALAGASPGARRG